MAEPVYRRVVIKLSGEYFAGPNSFGMDQPTIDRIAGDLIAAQRLGVEVAVVVGGGNMVRGVEVSSRGVSRPEVKLRKNCRKVREPAALFDCVLIVAATSRSCCATSG